MENEIRRSLNELVARYELEPELRDIYVEGKTDKLLLEWFLKQKGQEGFAVYEIDTVDIPAQKLFEFGLNDSKRGRVIYLALFLQKMLSEIPPHLTCVADKDFDWLFDIEYICDLLLFTDYSCLEMYLYNEITIDKFLRLSLRLNQIKTRNVLYQVSKILEKLYLLRATNEAFKLQMEWLDKFEDCCSINANKILFDIEKFIGKYLNKNRRNTQKDLFINKFNELAAKKLVDLRYKMHGHDFNEVLLWYIRPYLRKEIRHSYNSEILAGALLGCIDIEQLAQESLFQKLVSRMSV
ncbi:hypothetical protein [Scytonema sp. NUACC26]|uniref:hypothetical protein n=1 Tax=Scytonema sp. NUACC26 TaxID=3140176 RepID=UPI0034DC3B4A